MNQFINPESGPQPAGPYSTAVLTANGFLFLSGQISLDPATGNLNGRTVSEQAVIILNNIKNIVEECSFSLQDIIKVVIYITDISQFAELNKLYEQFFGSHKPVRTTVEVSRLPKGALVEIEAVCFHS